MAKLIVQSGPNKGTIYELSGEPMVLGRDLTCEIQVPDEKASRRHARIAREGDQWTLTDLGSRNGTLVNGTRMETRTLVPLDEVQVGDATLLFVADDEGRFELPPEDTSWIRPTIADTIVSDRIKLLTRGQVAHSSDELGRANDGLITLFRYSTLAAQAKAMAQLLDALVEAAKEAVAPDRVVPILIDPVSGEHRPWLRKESALDRKMAEVPVSRTIIEFALTERLSVLSHAPADDERFRHSPSVQLNRIATAMCVPLRSGDDVLGAVYADRIGDAEPFTRTDLELLTALALPTVVAVQNIRSAEGLRRECQVLEREVRGQYQIIGDSPKLHAVFDFIGRAAPLDSGVLLIGESGTGKELAARAIHYSGPRAKGPFEALNCAALTATLLESELFGHVKGAFTGAVEDRAGRFELADTGTLFLDEIAEMTPASQAKLLRVLETGEFRRVGDSRDRTSHARVVAASNQDLQGLVEAGKFRQDLFYRLNILTCPLPPLREHVEDLDLLCDHFVGHFCRKCGKRRLEFTQAARDALRSHPWPGNVRELRNLIERLVALSDKTVIDAADLPLDTPAAPRGPRDAGPPASIADVEREHIERVLRHTGGNKKEAAHILGIDRSTLYAKLKSYGIDL
ncbi:MAG TPA: sigma 54-interacting transcriptional regulator [Planctomycetota bacterium]|nr:sigma 54-interacting transcriptional regulator [Planctomycetota bacterium]